MVPAPTASGIERTQRVCAACYRTVSCEGPKSRDSHIPTGEGQVYPGPLSRRGKKATTRTQLKSNDADLFHPLTKVLF